MAGGGVVTADATAVARCVAVLRAGPAGLASDIDGTISAIAPTPGEAFVDAAARAALARLAARLAVVAVVSGRSAAVAAEMVGLPGLLYVGNHGMEQLRDGAARDHPGAAGAVDGVAAALAEIADGLAGTPLAGVAIIENKRLTGTVHYRLPESKVAARERLAPLVAAAAERHGLRVTEGRAILELRPDVVVNKGTALAGLVRGQGLRGFVFLGDDATDVDGFEALAALRAEGVATLSVGVAGPETPRRVLDTADLTVPGVAGCAALLTAVADALDAAAGEADGGPAGR